MPRKQSSPRLSTFAAQMFNRFSSGEYNYVIAYKIGPDGLSSCDMLPIDQLKALCASVLSQDETKGQKRAIRKRK